MRRRRNGPKISAKIRFSRAVREISDKEANRQSSLPLDSDPGWGSHGHAEAGRVENGRTQSDEPT